MSRIALIGKKLGMINLFDAEKVVPVTLIKVLPNVVIGTKDYGNRRCVVLAGNEEIKDKKVSKPQKTLFKDGIKPRAVIKEFEVSDKVSISAGTSMAIGDYLQDAIIDIRAKTIGKGFQGAMKRYGFGGMCASHGVSLTHRSLGSTGNRTLPGRVFKGKKMAGHMGDRNICIQNLSVYKVDAENNIIAVRGSIPGKENGVVYITNAIKKYTSDDNVLNGLVCEG